MNSIFRHYYVFCLLAFWGCDYFSAYPENHFSDMLVLNGSLELGDSTFRISLDTLIVYSSEDDIEKYCYDCYAVNYFQESFEKGEMSVELYENGEFKGYLEPHKIEDPNSWYDSLFNYSFSELNPSIENYINASKTLESPWRNFEMNFDNGIIAGNDYEIVVNHVSYPTIITKAKALSKVDIIDFSLTGDSLLVPDKQLAPIFNIELRDPNLNEKNYYMIRVNRYDEIATFWSDEIITYQYYSYEGALPLGEVSVDLLTTNQNYWSSREKPIFISDDDFDNGVFSLTGAILFSSDWVFNLEEEDEVLQQIISLYVSNVSKDYYNYVKALRNQYLNGFDPFATPVQIPSNIENGQGFFTITSTSEKSIRLNY